MKPEYRPATAEEFILVADLPAWKNHLVHVEGWPRGWQFYYRGTVDGIHDLETPKSHKKYRTDHRLLETRRQENWLRLSTQNHAK